MMKFVTQLMILNLWKQEQWLDKDWIKYEQKYLPNNLGRGEIQGRIFNFFFFKIR